MSAVMGADITIEGTLPDYAFERGQDIVPINPNVVLTLFMNESRCPHEFAVVSLPEGVAVEKMLFDSSCWRRISSSSVERPRIQRCGCGVNASDHSTH